MLNTRLHDIQVWIFVYIIFFFLFILPTFCNNPTSLRSVFSTGSTQLQLSVRTWALCVSVATCAVGPLGILSLSSSDLFLCNLQRGVCFISTEGISDRSLELKKAGLLQWDSLDKEPQAWIRAACGARKWYASYK